jgi:hypothetical protein
MKCRLLLVAQSVVGDCDTLSGVLNFRISQSGCMEDLASYPAGLRYVYLGDSSQSTDLVVPD